MAKNLLAEGLSLDLIKKVTKLPDLILTQPMRQESIAKAMRVEEPTIGVR
jgi:hypothetical protein